MPHGKAWVIKECPACHGTGNKDDRPCELCWGEKKIFIRWSAGPAIPHADLFIDMFTSILGNHFEGLENGKIFEKGI